MQQYKILDWDTKVFGFRVAKILTDQINEKNSYKLFNEMKKDKVKLVYWQFDELKKDLEIIAEQHNGFFTGKKVKYTKILNELNQVFINLPKGIKIEKYRLDTPNEDITKLIIQGAIFSRFYVDPKINKNQYEKIHKLWIKNSVKNNEIFVLEKNNIIIGFISLNEDEGIANIDFIVVAKSQRGNGYAGLLLKYAHNWAFLEGYKKIKAETQNENKIACNMYEKMHYEKFDIKNFYHFWL